MQRWIGAFFASVLVISSLQYTCINEVSGESSSNSESEIQHMQVNITKEVQHDEQAFTQGLLWYGGMLYESTGLEGESTLRELNPDGTVSQSEILDHARMNKPGQGFYKVLAESALRAVKLCQPLRVPTTGYERWKELQLNFDAREMLEG